jgi:hypothetical protein
VAVLVQYTLIVNAPTEQPDDNTCPIRFVYVYSTFCITCRSLGKHGKILGSECCHPFGTGSKFESLAFQEAGP